MIIPRFGGVSSPWNGSEPAKHHDLWLLVTGVAHRRQAYGATAERGESVEFEGGTENIVLMLWWR